MLWREERTAEDVVVVWQHGWRRIRRPGDDDRPGMCLCRARLPPGPSSTIRPAMHAASTFLCRRFIFTCTRLRADCRHDRCGRVEASHDRRSGEFGRTRGPGRFTRQRCCNGRARVIIQVSALRLPAASSVHACSRSLAVKMCECASRTQHPPTSDSPANGPVVVCLRWLLASGTSTCQPAAFDRIHPMHAKLAT
jgi:hypothetical protein